MTAATLHVVPETQKRQYGALLAARRRAREAFDYARTLPRRAWDWAFRTFHLDAAAAFARDVARWFGSKAAAAGRFLGITGGAGAGLLAVATDRGRAILGATVGRALRWGANALGWVWGTVKRGAYRIGGPFTLVGRAMARVETFTESIAARGLGFYAKNIGPHLAVDTPQMQIAKTAGVWLVALRALTFVSTTMISWPTYAALALYTLNQEPFRSLPGIEKASTWMRGEAAADPKHAKEVRDSLDAAVHAAAEATATGAPVAVPAPPNRAARRAEKRAPAAAK